MIPKENEFIKANNGMWRHRRYVLYFCILIAISEFAIALFIEPTKMQYLKEIFWISIGGNLLYVILYPLWTLIHDKGLGEALAKWLEKQ